MDTKEDNPGQTIERPDESEVMPGNPPETAPMTHSDREKSVAFSEESSGFSKVHKKFTSGNAAPRRRSVTSSSNHSSMALRRQPIDELLVPRGSVSHPGDTTVASSQAAESDFEDEYRNDILYKTCLRPGYTLNKQLMLSFGIINVITIIFVLVVCIVVAFTAGDTLKEINAIEFEMLAQERQGTTARYLAESLDQRLMLFDTIRIIVEATQDRFEGYPEASDDFVPFPDVLSNSSRYPISVDPAPFDWQLEPNIDENNYDEFLHSEARWDFYKFRPANAARAGFLIQGTCDPSVTDSSAQGYYENCTDANNNLTTGGIIAPSPTTEMIHRKASDLTPLMRTLFEARSEIRDLGLYFKNSGAGASFNYPQYTTGNGVYTSLGCEWMNLPNPLDPTKPLGTQEEIDRCHPNEESVSVREYNPLEREWCIFMAQNPDIIPAFVGPDSWNPGSYLLTVGQGIYDRTTKEFIACSYAGIQISAIDKELTKYKVTENSEVSIVVWEVPGNIASSTKLDSKNRTGDAVVSVFDVDLGLAKDSWDRLYTLVDYSKEWDPKEVEEAYANFAVDDDTYLVATHPMPPIPSEYDPNYVPIFLIVTSTKKSDLQEVVNDVNDIIDENVNQVNLYAIIISCIGLAVSFSIIVVMAHVITAPLRSMNSTANDIVNQFGDASAENLISKSDDLLRVNSIAPKTELSDVVAEFNKMVVSFSGKGMAKADKGKQEEVENIFNMRKSFIGIYESRKDKSFKWDITAKKERSIDPLDELSYRNEGSNLIDGTDDKNDVPLDIQGAQKKKTSPLFLWISVLIVVPLLLVTILVASLVLSSYTASVRDFLNRAEGHFLEVEKSALTVHAILRADYVAGLTSKSISDLHMYTRFSAWQLFGGLNATDSYTELFTGTEQCKEYSPNFDECPYVDTVNICDCDWNDNSVLRQCKNYDSAIESRSLQKQYFTGQTNGANPVTGDRNASRYPFESFSPETTSFYTDQTTVPGFESYSSLTGIETSYGRLRRLANGPIVPVIYNYNSKDRAMIGAFVATEADGMYVGMNTCRSDYIRNSRWQSSEANGAAELRPELCPLGKHGYDPRCREWYDTGKKQYESDGTSLYVTSPYSFASNDLIAQTATTALFHPQSGEHVGQVLLDFRTTSIYNALDVETDLKEGGFPVVVTTAGNVGDTVIAPGFEYATESAVPVASKVLAYDYGCDDGDCTNNLNRFAEIIASMKAGDSSNEAENPNVNIQFDRRKEDRSSETYFMAYAPVNVKSFDIVDSSDFSRGVKTSDFLIYSVGLANSKETMLAPFRGMEKKVNESITLAVIMLSVIVAFATLAVVYISRRLASSVTKPMLYLLELIRSINRNGLGQDVSSSKRIQASYEIVGFCDTMEILYKLVRSANSAFHAGELEVAYKVLVDALRLFKRLGNKKAIAVASNNLANTLLGMYRELKASHKDKLCGLRKKDMVRLGIGHFHTSIQMGERGYDEFHLAQGWSPACLDFTQHLANRYFNRGLFLLMTKDDHDKPEELKSLGNRDLQITRDMDQEVVAYGEDIGWGAADRLGQSFNVNLVRLRGYNQLIDMGYEDEWNIEDLIEDSFAMVKTEAQKESSRLFDTVSLPGRMQQIETELMKYLIRTGKTEEAAKVAIRMLVEDELVFVDALSTSIEVLLKYLETGPFEEEEREKMRETLEDYHEYLKIEAVKQKQSEIYKLESAISVKRSSEFVKSTSSTRQLDSERLSVWTLKECSGKFVTMEDF
ncbi:unnamed protein product [Cylindrotheca closterium]|uniref:Uncharacterized protein n=1 Tax=Cylindrotheca closterium TaxID=2856 RepID=A0AAD2FC76_9STRA|nr:unnamed protein product [Cylindrotheca closterium]